MQHQINKKMNKKYFHKVIIALAAILFLSNAMFAQTFVNESFARQIGSNFISNKMGKSDVQLNLFHTENGADGQANLYIYNVEGGGMVIVSASRMMRPVLAYNLNHGFEGEIPEPAWYFINNYSKNSDYCDERGIMMNSDVENEWNALENNELPLVRNTKTIAPLTQTQWNQDYPYNYYAPETSGSWWGGPGGHCYAGCVACAMAQIMKYWDHPVHGHGSHSYTHSTYGVQSANFGETYYDWDIMPNSLGWQADDPAKAVALLMYQCGVSVDMNFGPDGSGAYSKDVETAMRKYFGYCAAVYKERTQYSEDEWIALLKSELDKLQPVYFSGTSDSGGGHAIVCDGYDSNDYFNFNLGWGYGGDFYSINDVAGYHNNEAIVMNIKPLEINSDSNGIIYVASDGTGDGSSWANATNYLEYASALSTDVSKKIWVKSGTYYGDVNNDKGAFIIYKRNNVYGGFAGNETPDFNLDDRDFDANPTILDGQNQRCVLYQVDNISNTEMAVWDGFTIQNGFAGSGAGACIGGNTRLSNCKILNNNSNGFGGGVYIISAYYNNSSVRLVNCLFEGNNSSMGGALCDMIGATIENCRFTNNTANTKGGAYYIYANKDSKLVNTIFDNNNAKLGGAIYNKGKITMINCDLVNNNVTENGGAMYNETHNSKIYNSIFWGNNKNGTSNQIMGLSDYSYCAVQGGYSGTNNINLAAQNDGTDSGNYPRFANPDDGDFAIDRTSVCVNAGDNSVQGIVDPDYLGNPRIVDGKIDIGAIENQYYDLADEVSENEFEIYPNPIDNQLIIVKEGNIKIEVFNSLGQKIISTEAQNEMILNTSEWGRGIYFVKVNGVTRKVVK